MTLEPFVYRSVTHHHADGSVAARATHFALMRFTLPPGVTGILIWLGMRI